MATETVPSINNGRILVVSGGGSRGAWGAGFARYLTAQNGPYKIAFGTSTGSLMIPFVITNQFDKLKEAYTSVTREQIFDNKPFKANGELNVLNFLWRILRGKPSVGDTQNLRKLIQKFLSEDIYAQIRNEANGLLFGVTAVNLRTAKRCVKCSKDISDVAEMRDWMWASANQPLFMTYYPGKTEGYYVDGGVYDTIPILPALQYIAEHDGIRTIDVIINQPKNPILDNNCQPKTIFSGLLRLIEIWKTQIADDDVLIGLLAANVTIESFAVDAITINLYYFPPALYPDNVHDLDFNRERMTKLWEEGEKGVSQQEVHGQSGTIRLDKKRIKELMAVLQPSFET